MSFDLNGILVNIERLLAKVGLPAGPDQFINHKTLLGLILGAVGAVFGWLLTEPYQEDFSFWRDFLILAAVGCFIWVFVSSLDNIFERNLRAIFMGLKRTLYAPILIIVIVLATKIAVMGSSNIFQLPSLFRPPPEKLLKVFVLDVSGSMQGNPLDTLKKAVNAYVEVIEKNLSNNFVISLACVTFSDDAKLVEKPTSDYRAFLGKVNGIQAAGMTNIAAGLEVGEKIIRDFLGGTSDTSGKRVTGPKCEVILLSDGKPNRPTKVGDNNYPITTIWNGLAFYETGRIPVNSVGAGSDYHRSLMEQISQKTSGKFVAADDIASLPGHFEKLARDGLTQRRGSEEPGLSFIWRILGWAVIGFAIGVGSAMSRRSPKALFMGMVGGLLGGALGAIFFEGFQLATATVKQSSGVINRLGGFLLLGACVGFCVPFVESVAKTAWLRIIRGLGEGRLIILDRSPMILGRHELIDIPIFGDPQIDLKNLNLQKVGKDLQVETLGQDNLMVRDVKTQRGTLAHMDTFTVGNTKFVYLNRREGVTDKSAAVTEDKVPERMPRPAAVAAQEARRVQTHVATRRLPIYLVLDASRAMSGKPIKALNNGLKEFEAALKGEQAARGTAYVSVIAFGDEAKQAAPLTNAGQFKAPSVSTSGGSSLGKALTLLDHSLGSDVRPATASQPGDWKSLIFVIVGGEPTDSWQGPAENMRTRVAQRSANIIAIGLGQHIGGKTLKQLSRTALVMNDMQPDNIKALFEWITQAVKAASRSAALQATTGAESGGAQLPPLPPGIQIAG